MKRLNQSGDTIVEVVIAISIVSLALVGAYQATRHNTTSIQDTQEHTVALKLAESQIEALESAGTFGTTTTCFDPAHPDNQVTGTSCAYQPVAGGAKYNITVLRPGDPGNSSTVAYEASVKWVSLHGTSDQVSLFYRPEAP